jgi:Na+/H+-dicarboxylate symporter
MKQIFWTLMLALAVYLGFTVSHWLKPGSGLRFGNTATVVEQVQTLSDLVTVKYVIEKVVILDRTRNGMAKPRAAARARHRQGGH